MSAEIKPCPFCGAAAVRWADLVCCSKCPANNHVTTWSIRAPISSAPPANTVRVRVAVETNKDGFACVYWVGLQEEVGAPSEPGNRITYASLNAFLPEPAAEVEATIDNQKENA